MSPKCKTNPIPLISTLSVVQNIRQVVLCLSDFVHNRSRSLTRPSTGLTCCNVFSS